MGIESVPGGQNVLYGGTRNKIRLDRPWQSEIIIDPSTCPFENEVSICGGAAPGWKILANAYSPLASHKLIVPDECWPKEQLRTLGGSNEINAALATAQGLLEGGGERWLGAHVGPTAGQNQGHLHYHLVELQGSMLSDSEFEATSRLTDRTIYDCENIKVVVTGVRAGQCFFLPSHGAMTRAPLARALESIMSLYSRAFRSSQGLPPDFLVAMRFSGTAIRYATYIPILNQWGFTEYVGLLEKTPLVLPWSPAATVDYLRGIGSVHGKERKRNG